VLLLLLAFAPAGAALATALDASAAHTQAKRWADRRPPRSVAGVRGCMHACMHMHVCTC